MPVVGFLYSGLPESIANRAAGFRKGLGESGYVEGRNVAIEYRWAQNQIDRLPEYAADLVRRRVAVIAALDTPAAVAAKTVTTTIPIIFETGSDPVQIGLVAGLNRPGGNVTGVTSMTHELVAKRLGLLHETIPTAMRFAVLVNPNEPDADNIILDLQNAASSIGRQLEFFAARTNREIDAAFANLVLKRPDALFVGSQSLFTNRRAQILTLAARHGLPASYSAREYAEAGGLMSYGTDLVDAYRQGGIYTGRVLKGEKPSDLPVMRASKFEFIINLQTARTLGIEVPPTVLALADEVIE
jgi:putative ABC transport system substrate-binding protein